MVDGYSDTPKGTNISKSMVKIITYSFRVMRKQQCAVNYYVVQDLHINISIRYHVCVLKKCEHNIKKMSM